MSVVELKNPAANPSGVADATDLHPHLARMREADRRYGPPDYTDRCTALDALLDAIRKRQDDLCGALQRDFGCRSEVTSKIGDVVPSIAAIRYCRKNLKSWMLPERRRVAALYKPAKAFVVYGPKGVVGIVSPWNYPFNLTIGPMAAALAAGNRVLVKPSEYTPATSEFIAQLIGDVFDPAYVHVVTGDAEVGMAFTSLPFDHLLFTGATSVGRHVMRAAAETLTPVTLELGGKSPTIIADDAALERAVISIVTGKVFNAGQTCIAPDYVLLPEGKTDEFVSHARAAIAKMFPAMASNADYTSIINERHFKRLRGLINDAREKGAKIVELNPTSEEFDPALRKIPLTLIIDPTEEMECMHEEIFGPVMPVLTYSTLDEALDYINDRPRPLALYMYSDDDELMDKVLDETVSGGVCFNDVMFQFAQENLPFGGIGDSGMGAYHGHEGFETFSVKKPVFKQSRWSTGVLLRPPYGWLTKKAISFLVR